VDPSIPLPVELDSLNLRTNKSGQIMYQESLAEKLSWEMILSAMIQVIATDKKGAEDPLFEGIKPHWIQYYRTFVLALKPEIYNEFTGAAIIKAKNGDFDEALEIIEALEGLFPSFPEVLLNKALILEEKAAELEKNGRDIEADKVNEKTLETFQKALSTEPVLAELLFHAGFFFFRRKDYAQARSYFREYLSLADSSDEAGGDSKRIKKAQAIVNEIESQGLDDDRFMEALDLIRQGSEDEALYSIRDFLEEHPRVPNAWFVLGWALRKMGRWHDALDSYSKALELGSEGSDIRNEMAICLMELGKFGEARKELEAALHEEPENVKIISNLGVLALKNNQREEAAGFFRTVLELNPQDPIALDFFA
jgi:Tfp pilus assembly protein PilF